PAGAAPAPVRRDHVIRANHAFLAAVEIADDGADAFTVVPEARHLRAIAQLGAELLGAPAQNRLEHVRVDEEAARGAAAVDARIEIRDEPRQLLAGQRLDGHDAALGIVGLARFLPRLGLETRLAQNLYRADLEVAGARMNRRAGVALDGQA